MKKTYTVMTLLLLAVTFTGCSYFNNLFREEIDMNQVLVEKEKIDTMENPAMQLLLRQELGKKLIILNNVTVKEIAVSNNIDYDFCAIADVIENGKKIECYIYSKNVNIISKLEKNKSRINVEGDFGRFYTTLDDYYTKVEITGARIQIVEGSN